MEIAFSLCSGCTIKFRELRFDGAAAQASNQIPFNSIIWKDEYPPLREMPTRYDHPICIDSLIRLFHTRKLLWRTGKVSDDLKEFWRQAHETLPNWPGFQRLKLNGEDYGALDGCEEETNGIIESIRNDSAIFAVTDEGGGVSTFISYPTTPHPPIAPGSSNPQ